MTRESGSADIVRMYTCTQCKRHFPMSCTADIYGWQLQDAGKHVFCSYSCMRAYERPLMEKRQKRITKAFNQAMCPEYKQRDTGRL